jgi:hypothetical protein
MRTCPSTRFPRADAVRRAADSRTDTHLATMVSRTALNAVTYPVSPALAETAFMGI